MKKSIISIKFSIRLLVMSLLLSSPILLADDTDIYVGKGNVSVTGDALVMLSLDYRANLTSTVCNGYDANTPGSECYFLVNHNGENEPNKVDKVPTIYYELLGAVLKYVFWDANVSLGLMMNHQSVNNCVGPDAAACSNGGFIISGFDNGYEGDNDHSELFNKMASLPLPKGGASHPYQGKELFFEFFRYLTGQEVFNAHLGWVDFGTDADYNIDAAVKLNVPKTTAVGKLVGNVLGITDTSGTTILPDILEEGDAWHEVTFFNDGGFKTVETYPFDDADDFSTYSFFQLPIASVGLAGESATVKDATVSVLDWDSSIEDGTVYLSPLGEGDDCSKVFTINFMDGVLNSEADSDDNIIESKVNGGMPNVQLATDVDNNNNVLVFEEVLKYLYTTDFAASGTDAWGTVEDLAGFNNVTSYFLVPNPNTTTNDWARAGGSGMAIQFDNGADPEELVIKLEGVLNQILSVSTTFVSASVPVNVFNKAEFQDNLYIALFEANDGGNQRWIGNLKRLKLDLDNNIILDASSTPAPAFDANTGKLNHNIITYWTDPSDVRLDTAIDDALADMDGRAVGRGGAGQKIPGFLSDTDVGDTSDAVRKLYTDNGSALVPLHTTGANTWMSDLNALDETEALKIIKYIRGQDVNDIDGDSDFTEARAWLLGDPMHSRPFPVNYGALGSYSTDNHDIRILMASNDGFIRMFQNDPSGTTPDHTAADGGKEVWAYMPKEIFGIQKSLMNNTVGDHPYGIDGSIVVYTEDKNGDGTLDGRAEVAEDDRDKVHAYVGMRRGGSSYFALNLSDPDTPELLWKMSNTGVGGDFDQLGLTFAAPRIIKIRDGLNSPRLALAFSGGYSINKDVRDGSNPGTNDILYDADPDVDSDSSGEVPDPNAVPPTTVDGKTNDKDYGRGTAIYIVDAEDGTLIWKATYGTSTGSQSATHFAHNELVDSIPSTLTALDTVGDGITDRMYVGDTGGSIWRINLVGSTSQWGIHKFANLGRHETNTQANDRRFFHRPDFVKSRDIVSGAFDAVIVGSGDRANPKETAVQNHLYMLKDEDITSRVYTYTEPCDYIGRAAALTDVNGDGVTDNLDLLADIGNNVPNCPLDIGDLSDLTDNCIQDVGTSCIGVNNLTSNESNNGWYLKLGEGEKSLSTPLTLGGFVLYTTYLPNTEVEAAEGEEPLECGPAEGSGLLYVLDMHTAGAGIDFTSATHTYTDEDGNVITQSKTIDDRTRSIGAGIPADVVPLGDNKVLLPGGTVLKLPVKGTWSTFWYKKD